MNHFKFSHAAENGVFWMVVLLGTLGRLLSWPPIEQYCLASVVKGVYTPQSGIIQVGIVLACTVGWMAIYGFGSLLTMEKRDI